MCIEENKEMGLYSSKLGNSGLSKQKEEGQDCHRLLEGEEEAWMNE